MTWSTVEVNPVIPGSGRGRVASVTPLPPGTEGVFPINAPDGFGVPVRSSLFEEFSFSLRTDQDVAGITAPWCGGMPVDTLQHAAVAEMTFLPQEGGLPVLAFQPGGQNMEQYLVWDSSDGITPGAMVNLMP